MLCLGIESSCDETAASVIAFRNQKFEILSEEISSQTKLHEAYGGVVPELASREHLANLPVIVDVAMQRAGVSFDELSVIGVTSGPGLKGCLLIGVEFAKGLSLAKNIPLLGVNHIEGHIVAPQILHPELVPPYLCLIVSGGHTEIVHVEGIGRYKIMCRTTDDAAGEAFDKAANLLGFQYPGGARLAGEADLCPPEMQGIYKLPKVMREAEGFSFSGLKTAISLLIKKNPIVLTELPERRAMCWAIQDAIVGELLFKLKIALRETGALKVAVSGGVSANSLLRRRVSELGVNSYFPEMRHCTDNGTMIAFLALKRFIAGERSNLSLGVTSRWPVEDMVIL